MRAVDVIIKKRDGGRLSDEEIAAFIAGYLRGDITDYQTSALLMAIFLRGMDFEETASLTRHMMESGDVYDLEDLDLGTTVDKHSTGGVGDKVSLILAPLVAALGVTVPMVSGRGLGHTGGTLDKLESIPGFRVQLTAAEFKQQLKTIGVAMIGQSDNFVPADKRLYALRDVTGTIESIPLICASIMSKKIASGAHALVMDVKTGSGAFMQTQQAAHDLARNLIGVGLELGRPVRALITDMNQPLGRMIGNSLEVIECIDCMHGRGPADVRELTLELAAEMILLNRRESGDLARRTAFEEAAKALDDGRAWTKFRDMVAAQGGDVATVDDIAGLKVSEETDELRAETAGYISQMHCREIGNAAVVLGAGRARSSDHVDHSVGLEMLVRLGDRVEKGQPLVKIFHAGGRGLQPCRKRLTHAVTIGPQALSPPELTKERIA